jgi:subtilisin family serine protease
VAEQTFWYSELEPRASQEAAIIDAAFHRRGIDIDGDTDPAKDDRDVHAGGIAFMYAKDHLLTREQYLGGEGVMPGPRPPQGSGKQRGVLDVLHDHHLAEIEVRRVVHDVMLVCLNPQGHKHPRDLGDDTPEGDDASPGPGTGEGDDGDADGAKSNVLELLAEIDAELGVGAATPDHVLTAAQTLRPCSATEPVPPFPWAGPDPAVCRDGGAKVRIFVADTGLVKDAATTFPWLAGVRGRDDRRELPDGTIEPYGGHGTFVAGVLRSMAPEAQVYVADIFRTAGSALESELVRRLKWAFRFGFEILHLTAACMTRHNIPLLSLEAWLERLRAYQGVVCVAPAGNFYTRRPSWPGAFPDVLSVGALAADRHHRADFSNYGSWVDVYAPGENLINAYGTGRYTYQFEPDAPNVATFSGLAQWSGTSFSAPIVTGMIAARMVRCGESAREAADALLAEARAHRIPGVGPVLLPRCEGDDGCCGHGGCGCDRGCGCRGGGECGCDCGCGGGHRSHGPMRG